MSGAQRLAYTAIQRQSCSFCNSDIDFNRLKLEENTDSKFIANYSCRSCDSDLRISVSIDEDCVETIIEAESSGEELSKSITPKPALYQEGHAAEQLLSELHNLYRGVEILNNNQDRIFQIEDSTGQIVDNIFNRPFSDIQENFPTRDIVISLDETSDWGILDTEVHNYLAAAYSFDQLLETVRPKVEWGEAAESEFKKYKSRKKTILGLRHYVQHEGALSLSLRPKEHETGIRGDILTPLEEIEVMESQKAVYPPDGYKKGADHHFSEIDGDNVNISDQFKQHSINCGQLALEVLQNGLEERGDEIQEYEDWQDELAEYEDLIDR